MFSCHKQNDSATIHSNFLLFLFQGIGCTKITKDRSEDSINGNVETRSYLEKKLVFCFGSFVASQLLLPFGEENILSSSELKDAQEVVAAFKVLFFYRHNLCHLTLNGVGCR